MSEFSYNASASIVRTVKQGDRDFNLLEGVTVVPRAAIEISASCPPRYRKIIQECVSMGWIKPVAHVRDYELMWDHLHD